MFTIDVINLFLSMWFKPMLILMIMLSIAKNSFVFSAAASHWFLVCTLLVTCVALVFLNWLPEVNLSLVPHDFSPLTSIAVSFDGMPSTFLYLLILTYILVAVWVGFFQFFGLLEIRIITRRAQTITRPKAQVILQRLCVLYRIKPVINLRVTTELESPVMWGHLAPVILLPLSYEEWSDDRLTRVLAHELSHVGRSDWLIKIVCKFVCVIFWMVPLVWYVANKLEWFAELACDDSVVDSLNCRAEYAEDLMSLSADVSKSSWVLNFIRSSQLFMRIQHVLDGRNQRSSLGVKTKCLNVLICALLILPVSVLQAVPKPLELQFVLSVDYDLMLGEEMENKNDSHKPNWGPIFTSVENIPELKGALLTIADTPRFEEEVLVTAKERINLVNTTLGKPSVGEGSVLTELAFSDIAVPTVNIKGLLPQRMAVPLYPRRAIDRGVEGMVIVQFDIDENGYIKNPKIIVAQPNKIFNRAVLKALKKSRYRPMEIEGQAVKIKNVTETYYFKLYENATDKPANIKRPLQVRIAELDS